MIHPLIVVGAAVGGLYLLDARGFVDRSSLNGGGQAALATLPNAGTSAAAWVADQKASNPGNYKAALTQIIAAAQAGANASANPYPQADIPDVPWIFGTGHLDLGDYSEFRDALSNAQSTLATLPYAGLSDALEDAAWTSAAQLGVTMDAVGVDTTILQDVGSAAAYVAKLPGQAGSAVFGSIIDSIPWWVWLGLAAGVYVVVARPDFVKAAL